MAAHPLLRIKRGILLLHIEVSHRLFSLRWLTPLSPQRTKTMSSRLRARTRPRNRTLYDESNHRHRGTAHSLALDHSIEINQSEPVLCKNSPYPSTSLSLA